MDLYCKTCGQRWGDGHADDCTETDMGRLGKRLAAEYVERVFGVGVPWEINPGSEDDDVAEICDVVA